MLAAKLTGLFEPFAKLVPGAMKADGKIVHGRFQLACHVDDRPFLQVHFAKYGGVLGLEAINDSIHALTVFQVFVGIRREFVREPVEHLRLGRTAAVQVGNAVAQDAVEPGNDIFIVLHRTCRFHCLEQAILNDIRGEFGVGDPLARESNECIEQRH